MGAVPDDPDERRNIPSDADVPWRDEELLRRKYVDEGMSTIQIAEEWSTTSQTISRWLGEHEIDARSMEETWEHRSRTHGVGSCYRDKDGYLVYECSLAGEQDGRVRIHQLVAIAHGADPEEVFDRHIVHHVNGCELDNRPDNLEVLDRVEHWVLHRLLQMDARSQEKVIELCEAGK